MKIETVYPCSIGVKEISLNLYHLSFVSWEYGIFFFQNLVHKRTILLSLNN